MRKSKLQIERGNIGIAEKVQGTGPGMSQKYMSNRALEGLHVSMFSVLLESNSSL